MGVTVKIFGSELGARKARKTLDGLIDEQRSDTELAESMAPVWESLQRTRMSRPELEAATTGLIQRAADVKEVRNEFGNFAELQTRYRNGAETDQNHAILDSIDTQAQIARDRMLSSNPKLQDEGRALWAQVFTAQRDYATKNEDQEIAAQAAEDTEKRQLGLDRYQQRRELRGDYLKESSAYVEAAGSFQTLEGLYNSGATRDQPAASQAAAAAYMHVMNPTFQTLRTGTDPGEEFWSDLPFGKVIQQVWLNGASLTEAQWRSMYETGSSRMTEHNAEQAARNTSAEKSASLFLEPKYIDFLLPITPLATVAPAPQPTPAPAGGALPTVVPHRGAPPSGAEPDSAGTMVGTSIAAGVRSATDSAGDIVTGMFPELAKPIPVAPWKRPPPPDRTHVSGVIQRNTDEHVTRR